MKEPVFTGSSVALVTPFHAGEVDFSALNKLIEIQKLAGTSALTVCGTTGEASTMTLDERCRVISFAREHADGLKVIAGAGSNDTKTAVLNAIEAEKAGADALLVVTPYYNKASQDGLVEHYFRVADAVNIPVILYHVPSRTGASLLPETVEKLSRHPHINGIKDASGSFSFLTAVRRLCQDSCWVWSGNDDLTVPMMALGAKGVISAAANVIPQVMSEMTAACLTGDFSKAASLQISSAPLIAALFSEVNPIPVKALLAEMGLIHNELRLPLSPLSRDKTEVLIKEAACMGII